MTMKIRYLLFFAALFLSSNTLIAQLNINITKAEFYDTPEAIGSCPQNTITWYEDSLRFRTRIVFDNHQSNRIVTVKISHTYEGDDGNLKTEIYQTFNKLSNIQCNEPPNSFYIIAPSIPDECGNNWLIDSIDIKLHYGANILKIFEAKFNPPGNTFTDGCEMIINRPKPEVTGHEYVDQDADFFPNVKVRLFHDSIHFRTQLHYNDYLNSGDSVKVVIFRQINNEDFMRVDSAVGITQPNTTSITIPTDDSKFNVDLDPYYNDSIKVFFKAWFIREGHEFEPYNTQNTSILRIFHPVPKVDSVKYNDWEPPQVDTSNMAYTGIFNPEFKFNAKIDYNDPYSHSQDTICMDVFYNHLQIGETIKVATDSSGYQGAGNRTTIIPKIPELAFFPLEYFKDSVRFIAYFKGFSMEEDSIVKSDTLLLERIKPQIEDHLYINANMDLNSGNVPSTFERTIEFQVELTYNDYLSHLSNDTIVVTAILEIDQIGTITKTLKRRTYSDPDNKIIIPADNVDQFKFDIIPDYYNREMKLCFEAYFKRDDLIEPPIYLNPCANPVTIFRPKTKIESVKFIELDPPQLSNYFNTQKDIYNPQISFKIQTNHNDYLSEEEVVRIELEHTYNTTVSTIPQTQTTTSGVTTLSFTDNGIPFVFPLNLNDFDTHEFVVTAWFDADYLLPHDKMSSDKILIRYRWNYKPEIEWVTPFDSITNDNVVNITGRVYDETGVVDTLRIRINTEEEKFAKVVPSTPNYFNFSLTETLTEPINSINFIAKDTVDFYPAGSLESAEVNTRLNYLFWDTQDVFVPKDTNYRIIAQPPGGEFISTLTNPAGVFNPSLMPPGNYDVDYKYNTAYQSKTISKQVQILKAGSVTGNTSVCLNSYEPYEIVHSSSFEVDWKVNGGLITEFDIVTGAVEVKWVDNANVGNLTALIKPENADDAYELTGLVAINSKLAPPKAQVVRSDKVFFCSIDDAPYYQWKKDGVPVDGENKAWFYDPAHNPEAYYSVSVSYCEDCQPKPDCITDSYKILGSEMICEGCIIEQVWDITGLDEKDFTAGHAIVEVNITPVSFYNINLRVYDGTKEHYIEMEAQSMPEVHTLLLKNLTPGNSYKLKLIKNQ